MLKRTRGFFRGVSSDAGGGVAATHKQQGHTGAEAASAAPEGVQWIPPPEEEEEAAPSAKHPRTDEADSAPSFIAM